ncbi:DUF2510 domain-containing protein [Glaciihabitans sp. UYNi722]|uniref:DUF2510 domain-containing protein n=1 Tax=Glaciihabitans sp. UYNi722 TaxID=3156344 RepID=UPI0033957EB6
MTNTSGTPSASAGWYPDGDGSPQLRWWNGTQWTEHTHDPAEAASQTPYSLNAAAIPTVGTDKPVYNIFIWLIVLLPILSLISLATFDLTDYMRQTVSNPTRPGPVFTGPYLLLSGLGIVIYLVSVLLAYFDRKKLEADGFVRPFHWAWTFLGGVVYIIGRSVVAYRRTRSRGLWPIWAFAVIWVVSIVINSVKLADSLSSVLPHITSRS